MKILYICTHNRCRSILSEAVTNHKSDGSLVARSAGSQPSGEVHPLSLKYLAEAGMDTTGLQSQSWDDLEDFAPDLVVTVCDSAAGEACPVWFGQSLKVHWGLEDPSKLQGSDDEIAAAFRHTIQQIETRVDALQDIARLDKSLWPAALAQQGAK
ncbi:MULTISPECIES: arsenate reductase ArsC [unclassified Oceanobacter]|jgi:arsenate reductase|uniref:arsenate reductase ArsC n=1 Tax=unclassified Oceanobacter TaxID=2620260 RepID=UPI0026E117D8|nr:MULTISPECIES: arsenate reductase ArsC [unclassified Oceanobacter]MDO6682282.1 arsenate reductase ArsC [Oceanobacter sp. 5_MG-2023]MDP2506284.1 arsenate reductase ArsC [Oceanobacter sp. 3_MG-2023]MDP2546455.1 arsenate reductase ArsC [Oceanobacter sp. 4_MG-2023]MDP2609783.1 arsenate reductase ArsC [Oceanobacter sp. 1_MG-2023]MDP2613114.1 arsenate reductase ArsC [Oceanobacter sp. 2_MG-2023]